MKTSFALNTSSISTMKNVIHWPIHMNIIKSLRFFFQKENHHTSFRLLKWQCFVIDRSFFFIYILFISFAWANSIPIQTETKMNETERQRVDAYIKKTNQINNHNLTMKLTKKNQSQTISFSHFTYTYWVVLSISVYSVK